MLNHRLILERVLNTPLLAHPAKAEIVAAVVLRQANIEVNVAANAEIVNAPKRLGPLQEQMLREQDYDDRPFLFGQGIAVVEVTGSLAHRQWHLRESSGVMGYDGIGAQFDAARADREVRAIMIDIHSPGGEGSGCFQLADRIFAARGEKPLIAVADEMAFSAAYAIAAACDEVYLASETAGAGSVGAAYVHMSFERMIKGEGVKATIFQSGERKLEGNPLEDLSPETIEIIQAEVDLYGRMFEGRVAKWRRLSPEAVRATEAATFMGQTAIDVGFADGIATPFQVFDALIAEIGAPQTAGLVAVQQRSPT
jgi:ClpP class serine protease